MFTSRLYKTLNVDISGAAESNRDLSTSLVLVGLLLEFCGVGLGVNFRGLPRGLRFGSSGDGCRSNCKNKSTEKVTKSTCCLLKF